MPLEPRAIAIAHNLRAEAIGPPTAILRNSHRGRLGFWKVGVDRLGTPEGSGGGEEITTLRAVAVAIDLRAIAINGDDFYNAVTGGFGGPWGQKFGAKTQTQVEG